MNKAQLTAALDRMDRLYPNVARPDYRDEVLKVGRAFPPLARTAKQLADLLAEHRGTRHDVLLEQAGDRIRDLHDSLREQAHRLLDAKDWAYD